MAKTNPALHYSLFSWDSIDEFTQLDTLRKVIEIMPKAKQRVVRIKVKDSKHPVGIFGPCLRSTRKWKQSRVRRNALERINARVARYFLLMTTTSSAHRR